MAQVQIIQPYQPQSDALEKVAAYCRVSTDSKDQLNSYRTQIGYYTDFIAQHPGWGTSTPMRVLPAPAWRNGMNSNGCSRTAGPGRSSESW